MKRYRREVALAIAVGVLLAVLAVVAPAFFAAGNLTNLVVDHLPLLVVSTLMTFVILAGQIDISVGSTFAACGVLAGALAKTGCPMPLVVAATLAAGTLIGAGQGALVAWLGVPAIIATLAGMVTIRGTLRLLTGGRWIQNLPDDFQWLGLGQAGGSTLFFVISCVGFACAAVFLHRTRAGRAVAATGSNAHGARLLGVRTDRVVFGCFAGTGAAAALAALMNFTRYPSIEIEAGLGFELEVIACVVVGGAAITGGRATLVGTLLGVVLLTTIGSMLVFLGVASSWERAIQGLVILAAVTLDTATVKAARHA